MSAKTKAAEGLQTKWNTNRRYTANGQPMVAQLRDDGSVLFADQARMIWGVLTDGAPDYSTYPVQNVRRVTLYTPFYAEGDAALTLAEHERELREVVMHAYDHGHFASDDAARVLYFSE
jgi:hypothetical protein